MIQLLQGDCIEMMKTLPDKSIDLTVTSPPYDNLRTYNNSLIWNESVWKSAIKELFRLTKTGGVVVWVVGDATIKGSETGTSFKQALFFKEIGFNLHDTMIYKKDSIPKTHNRYEQDFEYMFIFSRGRPFAFNPILIENKQYGRGATGSTFRHTGTLPSKIHANNPIKKNRIKGNCWFIDCGYMRSTKYIDAYKHPAIFPEKLAHDHIISWSNEGDTVLDPFAGSGTTGVAAINTNRNAILIERDAGYCEIIKNRLADAEKNKANRLFVGE